MLTVLKIAATVLVGTLAAGIILLALYVLACVGVIAAKTLKKEIQKNDRN